MMITKKNISIITATRTGSTYLAHLLNHTDRFNKDIWLEELHHLETAPYKKFKHNVQQLISTEGGVIKDCGDWLWLIDSKHRNRSKLFNRYIRFLRGTYMVKLVRDDEFERLLSYCMAKITDIWHITEPLENRKIEISPIRFEYQYRTKLRKIEYTNRLFPNVDQVVNYKDLTFDPTIDIKLFPGLQLIKDYKPKTIAMNLNKIDVVTNYQELLELFNRLELGKIR